MNNAPYKQNQTGKVIGGLLLVIVGTVLLLQRTDLIFLPNWLFSWPVLLIVIGLFIGIKKRFQSPAPFILILVGGAFLADRLVDFDAGKFIWPALIIVFGLSLILKKTKGFKETKQGFNDQNREEDDWGIDAEPVDTKHNFVESTTAFGGIKKNIITKNFKGGEINTFFGGTELNFLQADFEDRVTLEITQVFGGTKIIIPANWEVVSEITAVFGGIEEKRHPHAIISDTRKILILRGTSIFAGIEIRTY